jgi:hypothetical protein
MEVEKLREQGGKWTRERMDKGTREQVNEWTSASGYVFAMTRITTLITSLL